MIHIREENTIQALQGEQVELILPYVHEDGEAEIRETFEKVLPLRKDGAATREVADRYFFETVVRVHRAVKARLLQG